MITRSRSSSSRASSRGLLPCIPRHNSGFGRIIQQFSGLSVGGCRERDGILGSDLRFRRGGHRGAGSLLSPFTVVNTTTTERARTTEYLPDRRHDPDHRDVFRSNGLKPPPPSQRPQQLPTVTMFQQMWPIMSEDTRAKAAKEIEVRSTGGLTTSLQDTPSRPARTCLPSTPTTTVVQFC